jgi:hypothetical protein
MALAVLVGGPAAYADRNDIELAQLGNPEVGGAHFNPVAHGDFRAFARTFAAIITSKNLMPPETLGHAGFSVNGELGVITLPSEVRLPMERAQDSSLLMPSVHVRKGLPFSLELGARVGWVDRSSLFATTGELKWAANEGFTWLPDIGVRAHVTRLMGTRDFNLTAAGLDLGVGKQFPIGGMVTLTPYGGVDLVGVHANTDTLDFRPTRQRSEALNPSDPYAGLEDTSVYQDVTLGQNINTRFYGGARFIAGALQLGAEVSLSNQGAIDVLNASTGETSSRDLPAVMALSGTLGLDF